MATGCDFICKNEECKYVGHGVVLTAPWPLGDIDKIISLAKDNKNELIKLKEEGRKYSCISMPNSENIDIVGYRIHMWCESCHCLWNYDVVLDNNTMDEAMKKANIPENCTKCNNRLNSFSEVLNDDIISCTSCNNKLNKNTWFCNE